MVKSQTATTETPRHRTSITIQKVLPYILIGASLLGLLASFALTYDKIRLLENPGYTPGCNINPVISCGDIMGKEQSNLLGLPNPIYGLVMFSALGMFGLLLLAGAQIKRWLWIGAEVAALLGVIFMHYLFFQGVYRIGAICPWCFLVWMITIPVFWDLTVRNIRAGVLACKQKWLARTADYFQAHAIDFLVLWYLIILLVLLTHFWYYWKTLL